MKQPTHLILLAVMFAASCGTHEKRTSDAQDSASGKVTDTSLLRGKPLPLAIAGAIIATPCSEKPTRPKVIPDNGATAKMAAEFEHLYDTGEFEMGYCVADVHVDSKGVPETTRVIRPAGIDKQVEDVIVRSISSTRYKPGIACGRPVAFDVTIGIGHCPVLIPRGRKSPG